MSSSPRKDTQATPSTLSKTPTRESPSGTPGSVRLTPTVDLTKTSSRQRFISKHLPTDLREKYEKKPDDVIASLLQSIEKLKSANAVLTRRIRKLDGRKDMESELAFSLQQLKEAREAAKMWKLECDSARSQVVDLQKVDKISGFTRLEALERQCEGLRRMDTQTKQELRKTQQELRRYTEREAQTRLLLGHTYGKFKAWALKCEEEGLTSEDPNPGVLSSVVEYFQGIVRSGNRSKKNEKLLRTKYDQTVKELQETKDKLATFEKLHKQHKQTEKQNAMKYQKDIEAMSVRMAELEESNSDLRLVASCLEHEGRAARRTSKLRERELIGQVKGARELASSAVFNHDKAERSLLRAHAELHRISGDVDSDERHHSPQPSAGVRNSISIQMSSSTDAVIQTVEPKFVLEGNYSCCPIPGDAPNIKSAEFPTIKAIWGESYRYDQSFEAQEMVKGECNTGQYTHISIPFSSSSPMKGAYICLIGASSSYGTTSPSHLIFTLTSSKGDKTSKKYEFPEFKGRHWYFLPVDLPDVVLCEITGKGREKEYFDIQSLVFISREETPEEITSREAREKLWSEAPVVKAEFVKEGWRDSIPIPRDDPKLVDPSFSMVKCKDDSVSKESEYYDQSSDAQKMLKGEDKITSREAREKLWSGAPVVKAEFVKEGWRDSIPIPRDDPKLVDPSFSMVKCKDDSVSKESEYYDQSSDAQKMLKGEDSVELSHLSIPFPSPSSMKGAYICVDDFNSSPSLLFIFTDCDGKKTSKKYEFTEPEHKYEWHFLPIDLDNVVLCEIEGKGRWKEKNSRYINIISLVFTTFPEETIAAERLSLLPWK
ncbi:hypothetical protein ADUPG1_008754 [Aduncisulcus paluster]|uniref:Uncharacterized protein n=1 Tax=Aduncisulcus paluster TaxID=2918883 RepID=A0ABQ5KT46_9EUKA|nr:hypothetical protein ADUPG1_008754 [Aduncisulcus paluster]